MEGFEFAADEGVEVVGADVGFGHFGEVFLVVGEGVVSGVVASDVHDVFELVGVAGAFEGFDDFGVVEAEELVVVGVGKLVEDDPGLVLFFSVVDEAGGAGDVDAFDHFGIVAVVLEPACTGVVLHGAEFVFVVEVDFDGFEFVDGFFGEDEFDAVEFVGEDALGGLAEFGVFALEEGFVDVDSPAFDLLDLVFGELGFGGFFIGLEGGLIWREGGECDEED